MSLTAEYIIAPWEAETYVQSLEMTDLQDICTKKWFEFHKRLLLLNQQCVLEINEFREESIKEWFVCLKKIPILIYEAIQIDIWKHKVFPLLIELNNEPENTFMLFSIFYHEEVAASLLENVLFHCESAITMDDAVLDLIDYAVKCVTVLLNRNDVEIYENLKDSSSCLEELLEKKKELEFDIGMRCISILRYLAEFLDNLPLSAILRMLSIHDIPYLLVQLIENHPWSKNDSEGNLLLYDGKWNKVKDNEAGKLSKVEAQVWFGLRELLLNPKCAPYYEITEYRLSNLLKLHKYLHEIVLDQIAPLIDLKRWLSYLSMSSTSSTTSRPIYVEVIPEIKATILKKYHKKWRKLAKHQAKSIFTKDTDYIKNSAKILSDAYDLDKLDCIDVKKCFLCQEQAKKRCSKCKEAWYCGRECQVKDWSNHKDICEKITNGRDNN